MDKLSSQQRHANMAAIRSKNTKPEMIVRHGLWKRGFRYRLNHKRLPGHPDLVLRKYRTCIFVNGCFWHGHLVDMKVFENSECCKIPKTNRDFWVAKIRRNKERDREEQRTSGFRIMEQKRLLIRNWKKRICRCRWRQRVRCDELRQLEQSRQLYKTYPIANTLRSQLYFTALSW